MTTIGIIVAMTSEFEFVSEILQNRQESNINGFRFISGDLYNKQVILLKSGIGKVCSALGAVEMIKNFAPNYIINSGIAGGIDLKTQVMDVVVGEEIVYHDVWCGEGNEYGQVQEFPARYKSNDYLLKCIKNIVCDLNVYSGLICSGDKFITDKVELAAIKDKFPAGLAVDMESASIAQTCYAYHTPYLSLRIISDTPGVENHWQQYENFWNKAPQNSIRVLQELIKQI